MVVSWIKFLKKENKEVSRRIYNVVNKIIEGRTTGLDIKPIEGMDNYYRCRIGNIRIIYKNTNGNIFIKDIGYRGDIYK